MEHWSIAEDPVSDGGEEAFRTVHMVVRKKQGLSKSLYIPKVFVHRFFNTPLLQHSNTPTKR
jgi:hypothetical protein